MSEISSEDSDPLMLAFGQACFVAQNLESTLTFLLVLNRSAGSGLIIEDRALKSVESETRRKAARALLNEAVAADEIGADVEREIVEAIKSRNYLMHEFWDRNASLLATQDGRAHIIAELTASKQLISQAERKIRALVDVHLSKFGMETETIKEFSGRFYEKGPPKIRTEH